MNRLFYIFVFSFFGSAMLNAQQVYYPLETGNRWEYWYYEGMPYGWYNQTTVITGDTIMPNGKHYAVGVFQRQEGDSVYQYNINSQDEFLLYDFSRSAGDTVNSFSNGNDTTDIILTEKNTNSIFGKNLRCCKFFINHNRSTWDDEEFDFITDSIGLTQITFAFTSVTILEGAVISGKRLGTLLSSQYPLQTGNRWEYDSMNSTRNTIVRDTICSNGKRYSVFSGNYFLISRYQRQSGDSLFIYNSLTQQEYLFCDFSLRSTSQQMLISKIPSEGELSETVNVYMSNYKMKSLFGKNLRQWDIYFDNPGIFDDGIRYEITDSIGITSITPNQGETKHLTGAVINGVHYGTLTDVNQQVNQVPLSFSLNQNYPNPFNPTTIITYSLREQSSVTLQIFDVLGKGTVHLLFNKQQEAGLHTVQFDGTNYPSGIYFYKLSAQGNSSEYLQTRKMILQK